MLEGMEFEAYSFFSLIPHENVGWYTLLVLEQTVWLRMSTDVKINKIDELQNTLLKNQILIFLTKNTNMINCILFWTFYAPKTLQDIAWLKSITKLPILIKGILTSEDGNYYWTLDVCIA